MFLVRWSGGRQRFRNALARVSKWERSISMIVSTSCVTRLTWKVGFWGQKNKWVTCCLGVFQTQQCWINPDWWSTWLWMIIMKVNGLSSTSMNVYLKVEKAALREKQEQVIQEQVWPQYTITYVDLCVDWQLLVHYTWSQNSLTGLWRYLFYRGFLNLHWLN